MKTEEFTHFTTSRFFRLLSACLLLLCVEACYKSVLPNEDIVVEEDIVYGDPAEMTRTPLSLEARRDGYIRIINPLRTEIIYTINGGKTISNNKLKVLIIVKEGDVVQLYGNANTYNGARIECSSPFYISGNIMSLIRAEGFESIEEIPEEGAFRFFFYGNTYIYNHPEKELILPATVMKPYCYSDMFHGCTGLVVAPKLPATVLAKSCYHEMFEHCTSLKVAPGLPAKSLADHCYSNMFRWCTSLTEAPELPATTLAESCYSDMFEKCTSLTSAPKLPAMTLANWCYAGMFTSCTGLSSAPELPAMTLASMCYRSMFYACTGMKTALVLPATTLAEGCYAEMFAECTGLTSAPSLPATQLAPACYSAMFRYCINLTEAPELPARELVSKCYSQMFKDCSKLSYIKALFVTAPGNDFTPSWVQNVSKSGVFVKSSAASWDEHGESGIPEGWTVK